MCFHNGFAFLVPPPNRQATNPYVSSKCKPFIRVTLRKKYLKKNNTERAVTLYYPNGVKHISFVIQFYYCYENVQMNSILWSQIFTARRRHANYSETKHSLLFRVPNVKKIIKKKQKTFHSDSSLSPKKCHFVEQTVAWTLL